MLNLIPYKFKQVPEGEREFYNRHQSECHENSEKFYLFGMETEIIDNTTDLSSLILALDGFCMLFSCSLPFIDIQEQFIERFLLVISNHARNNMMDVNVTKPIFCIFSIFSDYLLEIDFELIIEIINTIFPIILKDDFYNQIFIRFIADHSEIREFAIEKILLEYNHEIDDFVDEIIRSLFIFYEIRKIDSHFDQNYESVFIEIITKMFQNQKYPPYIWMFLEDNRFLLLNDQFPILKCKKILHTELQFNDTQNLKHIVFTYLMLDSSFENLNFLLNLIINDIRFDHEDILLVFFEFSFHLSTFTELEHEIFYIFIQYINKIFFELTFNAKYILIQKLYIIFNSNKTSRQMVIVLKLIYNFLLDLFNYDEPISESYLTIQGQSP